MVKTWQIKKIADIKVQFMKIKLQFLLENNFRVLVSRFILMIVWVIDYFYLPRFFVGIVCGIIAHDIYDYNDWRKVLVKNEIQPV